MESSKYESLIRVGKKPGHAVKASTKIQMAVLLKILINNAGLLLLIMRSESIKNYI